ncbi:MAG: hypothetical protein IPK82_35050 [Polyangiaceae bacterium]|nr:hypothetical protein [Polyangiaceae bacterium]
MGMFDWYEPQPTLMCRKCGAPLGRWQGKDGACALWVWRQGVVAPIDQEVDEECQAWLEVRTAERLPERFEIYTTCDHCDQWVDATGFCERGVWVTTARGRHGESVPIAATRIDKQFRQCARCTHVWEEAENPTVRLAGCPSCGALTNLTVDADCN